MVESGRIAAAPHWRRYGRTGRVPRVLWVLITFVVLVAIIVVVGLLSPKSNDYGFWPDKQRDEFRDGF